MAPCPKKRTIPPIASNTTTVPARNKKADQRAARRPTFWAMENPATAPTSGSVQQALAMAQRTPKANEKAMDMGPNPVLLSIVLTAAIISCTKKIPL
jgi:hypothetical protein